MGERALTATETPTETATEYDIRLVGLTKRFDDVVAVDGISLDIGRGHFIALLGPSGCGKTTTLRMIGGFEEPTEGRIELGGVDVAPLPPYKRDVNTVFQSYALFPHLSIFENVAFGLRRRGVKGDDLRRRVGESLELVGLAGLERRKPRQLSGGQQQRIALARALVNRPRVLLLDEPLGALDLKLRKEMQLELKRIQAEVGITFVHVTHDQEEAMTMADRIVIMNGGRIEQEGTPSELYETPRTPFVAGFLGASNLLEGEVAGEERVKLADGTEVRVPREALAGRSGAVQIGVRPEKLRIGGGEGNSLSGVVTESAYIGVSTQYILDTPAGPVTVYMQNDRPGGQVATGERLTLSWSPESTFVVDSQEGTQ
jgi:spermidine/putrescine transport system ATP-binding protein